MVTLVKIHKHNNVTKCSIHQSMSMFNQSCTGHRTILASQINVTQIFKSEQDGSDPGKQRPAIMNNNNNNNNNNN